MADRIRVTSLIEVLARGRDNRDSGASITAGRLCVQLRPPLVGKAGAMSARSPTGEGLAWPEGLSGRFLSRLDCPFVVGQRPTLSGAGTAGGLLRTRKSPAIKPLGSPRIRLNTSTSRSGA